MSTVILNGQFSYNNVGLYWITNKHGFVHRLYLDGAFVGFVVKRGDMWLAKRFTRDHLATKAVASVDNLAVAKAALETIVS